MELIRILSAQPTADGEKVRITASVHRDDWYLDSFGQNPTPYFRNPFLGTPNRLPYPWNPSVQIFSGYDVVFSNGTGFDLDVDVSQYPAILSASGPAPVNVGSAIARPRVPLQGSTSSTGGYLEGGKTYYAAISWNGFIGPVHDLFIATAVPAGTSTNKITISGIVWPDGAAPSPALFLGYSPLDMNYLGPAGVTWSAIATDTNGNPTAIEITDIRLTDGNLPDQAAQTFIMRQTPIVHGGVWGDVAGSVETVSAFAYDLVFRNAAWTVNQWAGYTLSLYYRAGDHPQYPLNLSVVSNTANKLRLVRGLSIPEFAAGDVVVMRAKADHLGSGDTVGDDNFINSYAPSGLSTAGDEIGRQIRVIGGAGAGQPARTVKSNTSKIYTVTEKFNPALDSTSIWIVTAPSSYPSAQSKIFVNDGLGASSGAVISAPTASTSAQSLLVEAATADAHGNAMDMRLQPFREIYVPAQNTPGAAMDPITPSGGVAPLDLSNGKYHKLLLLTGSAVAFSSPTRAGGFIDGDEFRLSIQTRSSGTWDSPTFPGGAGGFASDVADGSAYQSSPVPQYDVRDELLFRYYGGVWALVSARLGSPIS